MTKLINLKGTEASKFAKQNTIITSNVELKKMKKQCDGFSTVHFGVKYSFQNNRTIAEDQREPKKFEGKLRIIKEGSSISSLRIYTVVDGEDVGNDNKPPKKPSYPWGLNFEDEGTDENATLFRVPLIDSLLKISNHNGRYRVVVENNKLDDRDMATQLESYISSMLNKVRCDEAIEKVINMVVNTGFVFVNNIEVYSRKDSAYLSADIFTINHDAELIDIMELDSVSMIGTNWSNNLPVNAKGYKNIYRYKINIVKEGELKNGK